MVTNVRKAVSLEIHQLRTLLELCEASTNSPETGADTEVVKEVADEAKGILWKAIDAQRISEMSKITLKAASKNTERRKRAFKVQKRTEELMRQITRTNWLDKVSDRLYRWASRQAHDNNRRPLYQLRLTTSKERFHTEAFKVVEMINKAEHLVTDYHTHRQAAEGMEADDCLEEAEVRLKDAHMATQSLMPIELGTEDELPRVASNKTWYIGEWEVVDGDKRSSATSDGDDLSIPQQHRNFSSRARIDTDLPSKGAAQRPLRSW